MVISMKKSIIRPRILLSCLTLLIALPLYSQDAAKKALAVFPFANNTGSDAYGAACDAAANSLVLTLKSLEGYDVQVLGADPVERSEEALASWAENAKVDIVLYGGLSLNADGKVQASLSAFDRQKAATIVTKKSDYVKLMDIFHTSDDLVVAVLADMTGKHIGFARLEFHNSGQPGSYEVAIDGAVVGKNLDAIAGWREGKHELVVRQKRMLGEYELYKQTVTLVEGKTFEVDFSVPLLTEAEKVKVEGLESAIRSRWDKGEAAAEVDSLIAQYTDLFKDVDYCPALSAYRDKAAKLAMDWAAQKQKLSDRAQEQGEVKPDLSKLAAAVAQLDAGLKAEANAANDRDRSIAETRAVLDALSQNLRDGFTSEENKAKADLRLRGALDTGGWISLAACILGAAGAGAAYYFGNQAFTSYQTATTSTAADSALLSLQLCTIGLYTGAAVGGLGLILTPIFFSVGPNKAEALAEKAESETMLKALGPE